MRDFVDIEPAADGMSLRMSENVTEVLWDVFESFAKALRDPQDPVHGRLELGSELEAVREAADRVLGFWTRTTFLVVEHDRLDDLMMIVGLARFRYVDRRGRGPKKDRLTVHWLSHVNSRLAFLRSPALFRPNV
ncbi:hypothetical protein D5S17_19185 [Pseudonocardiaceae bacterium YIM PH 21723]|nr:hypothetical protein D5S17_19185 [Pseudonocardiaceae bacterium YIM PH 21723]